MAEGGRGGDRCGPRLDNSWLGDRPAGGDRNWKQSWLDSCTVDVHVLGPLHLQIHRLAILLVLHLTPAVVARY